MKRSHPKLGATGWGAGLKQEAKQTRSISEMLHAALFAPWLASTSMQVTPGRLLATTADQEPQQSTPEAAPPAPQPRAATQSM